MSNRSAYTVEGRGYVLRVSRHKLHEQVIKKYSMKEILYEFRKAGASNVGPVISESFS